MAEDKSQPATAEQTPLSGVQEKVQTTTDSALSTIDSYGNKIAAKGRGILDSIFPPEKRSAFLAKLQAFIMANPKVSAFLGMNLALTGIPLGLFIFFSLTVFIFALVVALVIGLLAAVAFTLIAVGAALFFVFPAVLFTTGAATFLFLWGLGGYYILRWANNDKKEQKSGQAGGQSMAIGDVVNRWSGGRLQGLTGGTSAKEQGSDEQMNGSAKEESKGMQAASQAQKSINETQRHVGNAASRAGAVTKPVSNVTNTAGAVKGGLGGATGINV